MASKDFQTRSGLVPNEAQLPFSITTSDVEAYLQKKIDTMLNKAANQSGETADKIDVRVYTTEAGKGFLPFVVILPLEALDNRQKRQNKPMPSIFDTKGTDGTANLKKEIYDVLSAYTFNKQDGEMFKSDSWRRDHHVNREATTVLLGMRTPKVVSMEGGRLKVVELMIDPIRVFHDMLKMQDDTRNFMVNIDGWQKIQTGEFRYDVKRALNKSKGKKYKNTLADELNRKMRGSRR